jgi:hypothetical protein
VGLSLVLQAGPILAVDGDVLWSPLGYPTLDEVYAPSRGWIYLSTEPHEYNCDDNGRAWESGAKTIYLVIETPYWQSGEAYDAVEFGLDYDPRLFSLGATSPDAPAPHFAGSCAQGHCSYQVETGGPVHNNPWTAIALEFLNFGAGANLGFSLAPADNASPRAGWRPAWSYANPEAPPVIVPEAGEGSWHPGWQTGFVVLNYDQGTAPATPFPRREYTWREPRYDWPSWDSGDPCNRGAIGDDFSRGTALDTRSWGSLKSNFRER